MVSLLASSSRPRSSLQLRSKVCSWRPMIASKAEVSLRLGERGSRMRSRSRLSAMGRLICFLMASTELVRLEEEARVRVLVPLGFARSLWV